MTEAKKKIRIVIRTLNDLLDLQVLRWKRKYPDAKEPDEWSDNEIKPGDRFDPTQEISEGAVSIIREDDMKRTASRNADGGPGGRGLYARGFGKDHQTEGFQSLAKHDADEHYEARLAAAGDAMAKEFDLSDEYEIVFEGEYAKIILDQREKG